MLLVYVAFTIAVAAIVPAFAAKMVAVLQKELLNDLAAAQSLNADSLIHNARAVSKGTAFAVFLLLTLIISFLYYRLGQDAFIYCFFVILLGVIALMDWMVELIPEWSTGALLWVGIFASLFEFTSLPVDQALVGAACGWLLFTLPNFMLEVFKGEKDAVGLGDVSFLAGLGAWLGPKGAVSTALLSIGLALSIRLWLRVRGKEVRFIAFGPFLSLSAAMVLVHLLL